MRRLETVEHVYAAVSGQLRREPMKPVWEFLALDQGRALDVVRATDQQEELDDLIRDIQRFEKRCRDGNLRSGTPPLTAGGVPRSATNHPAVVARVHQDARLRALAAINAVEAGRVRAVLEFRRDVLGNKLLEAPAPIERLGEGGLVHKSFPGAGHWERWIRDKAEHREQLADVAGALTHLFGWDERTGTRFILTGEPAPLEDQFAASHVIRAMGKRPRANRVVIRANPLVVPAHAIAECSELLPGARKARAARKAGGNATRDPRWPAREITEKHASLAIHAAEVAGTEATWDESRRDWNKRRPQWAYDGSSRKQFEKDSRLAYLRVTDEKLPWPRRAGRRRLRSTKRVASRSS